MDGWKDERRNEQLTNRTKTSFLRIPLTNSVHTGQCKEDFRNGIKEQGVGDSSKTQ